MLCCVWKNTRNWSHWNSSLDMHLNYLLSPKHRMFLSDFLPWIPFRVHCPGLIAAACSLTLCITEWWATLFPLFCLWKEGSLDGSEEWWHQKAEENIYIMCDVLYKKRNDKKLYNTCIVALKEIQESIASVKYEKQG